MRAIATSARLTWRPGRLSTLLEQRLLRRDAAGAAVAGGSVLLLSLADGGFFPGAWRAATAAFLCIGGLGLVVRRRTHVGGGQWLLAGGLAAFAGWVALSSLWSPDPAAATLEAQRTLVYVAAVAAAVVVGGWLLAGVLAGVAVTCAYALGLRLVQGQGEPDAFQLRLLHEPLGYANALAGLAAIGLAVAAGGLVRDRWHRLLGAALVALCGTTLALTQSRGGFVAAAVGVAVALALGAGRVRIARVLALLAGLFVAVLLALPAGGLADDLAELGEERAWYWHVAWQDVAESPAAGRGAGTFELAWLERQPVPWSVLDAHSLYLETLAELGIVGLLVVGLALFPPLVAGLRGAAAPAAVGGYLAFLVHAGMDWDWEMPAVTVAGLLCACSILAAGREPSRRRGGRRYSHPGVPGGS